MSEESKPIGGEVLTKPFKVLMAFALFAAALVVIRFIFGLGSVTNMNDGYPWGIWIAYDVVAGTAVACGGYAMAILVYVMNKGEYHPLVRPALLASMFGYTLAGVSVMFDIGRYWQAYNLFLPAFANPNSILFEVALCIALYSLVLWLEFIPAFLEGLVKHKHGLPKFVQNWDVRGLQKFWNKILFFFIAVGILLPTMHQSSLGTMMIIAGKKLSPLWQTGMLPLLYLISAVTMGYGIVIFESIYSSQGLKRPMETSMLARLSGIIPWLLGSFVVVRLGDVIFRGALGSLFHFNKNTLMFIIEIALFVYPLVVLMNKGNRTRPRALFLSAAAIILAGSLYRFNSYLIALSPGPGWHYFPSFSEIMITFGIISFEIMAYLYIVKKFPVLPKAEHA
ncbi:MAG: Ni/Fe-hydrogenase cytochrome b subunit [Nitrospirae bacterium]|nr:Ni/Fe-hydrogenase cytochrome b subunit [Nitrospirota bacterium]